MSLNDIQTELESIKSKSATINDSSQKNIKDILKNNIVRMEQFMDSKVINIYSRPWNKLEPKLKKQKIQEYLNSLLETNMITLDIFNSLFHKISRAIMLNEKIKLEYDTDKCSIISFDYESYL
jgi:hypothetical protein